MHPPHRPDHGQGIFVTGDSPAGIDDPYSNDPAKAYTAGNNPEPHLTKLIQGAPGPVYPSAPKDHSKDAERADFKKRTAGQAATKAKIMAAYNKGRKK